MGFRALSMLELQMTRQAHDVTLCEGLQLVKGGCWDLFQAEIPEIKDRVWVLIPEVVGHWAKLWSREKQLKELIQMEFKQTNEN